MDGSLMTAMLQAIIACPGPRLYLTDSPGLQGGRP